MRYAKENNSFYARLVDQEIDKRNPVKLVDGRKEFNYIVAEEEIKVEEEWVQNEYDNKVVQHVINMNQTNNWVDVPKDVEIRIAKKKVVRVRFIAKHTGMYWTMTRWQRRFGARISRIAKGGSCLGFRIFQRQMQQLIQSIKFNVLPQEEHQ